MKIISSYWGFLLILSANIFSQSYNYNNGNGEVIDIKNNGNEIITIRRHEQIIILGNLAANESLKIYEDTNNKKLKYTLNGDEKIQSSKILTKYSNNKLMKVMLNIKYEKVYGWIDLQLKDPYENGNWSIIERIQTTKKLYTIRKINQKLQYVKELSIKDKPDENGNELFKIFPSQTNRIASINAIGITDEKENIFGKNQRWVKIMDNNNRIGWVLEGMFILTRDGPLIWSPEEIIYYELSVF